MDDTRAPWWLRTVLAAGVFAFTFACRTRGVTDQFWLLGDQIRDWSIALRPFTELPLVGPPTHVGGYTIGPAYYWLMWGIRVTLGPWFDNLPHGGGIGQAIVESAADAVLFVALCRRIGSPWLALAGVLAIATSAFDMALSAIVWTTVVASAFGKVAIALMLLRWHQASLWRVALVAAVAWSAVHVYTGAIFVTVGVFMAMVAEPAVSRDRKSLVHRAAVLAGVVGALQVPWLLYHLQTGFSAPTMGAVTGSVRLVLSGEQGAQVAKSVDGLAAAFNYIQVQPWNVTWLPWAILAAGVVVALRYRHDLPLVTLLLVPQAAALAGYALFLGSVDHYYYIPVVPVMLLTVVFAVSPPSRRARTALGVAMLAGVTALIPARLQMAATLHKLPEYGVLLDASRRIVGTRLPMRAVMADFPLPPTAEPDFLYRVLGGQIEPGAPHMAVIRRDGQVEYRRPQD